MKGRDAWIQKDGRQFQRFQEAYSNINQQAIDQGHPPVPGTIAYNAPPPPPPSANHGASVAAAAHQQQLAQQIKPIYYTCKRCLSETTWKLMLKDF
jgi:hypothetical protein